MGCSPGVLQELAEDSVPLYDVIFTLHFIPDAEEEISEVPFVSVESLGWKELRFFI